MQLNGMNVLKLTGTVNVRDNGTNAKSFPVKLIANAGDPHIVPDVGWAVFDFDTMIHKPKIPLDWEHSDGEDIGYVNHFDTSTGSLVLSGVILPWGEDKGAEVVFKMSEGQPYQASVESHNYTLELVEEGETIKVNQKRVAGPVIVIRNWTLDATAICKFGADANTQVIAASASTQKKTPQKIFLTRKSNLGNTMTIDPKNAVEAVNPVEAVEVKSDDVKVEAAAIPPAVEASQSAEVKPVEADERAEFKRFFGTFGPDAAGYFAEGLSFEDATAKQMAKLVETNLQLSKEVKALKASRSTGGGLDAPVHIEPQKEESDKPAIFRFRK